MNRHFTREDIWMADMHMKIYSTLLAIWERQIKMRYHVSIRTAMWHQMLTKDVKKLLLRWCEYEMLVTLEKFHNFYKTKHSTHPQGSLFIWFGETTHLVSYNLLLACYINGMILWDLLGLAFLTPQTFLEIHSICVYQQFTFLLMTWIYLD